MYLKSFIFTTLLSQLLLTEAALLISTTTELQTPASNSLLEGMHGSDSAISWSSRGDRATVRRRRYHVLCVLVISLLGREGFVKIFYNQITSREGGACENSKYFIIR